MGLGEKDIYSSDSDIEEDDEATQLILPRSAGRVVLKNPITLTEKRDEIKSPPRVASLKKRVQSYLRLV